MSDNHENIKDTVSSQDSKPTEQPSIEISVPQGLDAEIQVREEEDLETVLANLELLARRQDFDAEALNRSVSEEHESESIDEDLLGWIEQLDESIEKVEEHLQELDERIDSVEDEFSGEDSQVAEMMNRIRELDESVDDLPEDVSRHLAELREQIEALEGHVDDVEDYAASLDDDMEALRQRIGEDETEAADRQPSQVEQESSEEDHKANEGRYSVSDFRSLEKEKRAEKIKQVIRNYGPIGTSGICEKLFGQDAGTSTPPYTAVQNGMQGFRDELEYEKDGRKRRYYFPEDIDESEDEETEEEDADVEGLYSSLEDFRQLPRERRAEEIKEVIEEIQPADTQEISKELLGEKANSGTPIYTEIQDCLKKIEDNLEKEKDVRKSYYSISDGVDEQEEPVASPSIESGEPEPSAAPEGGEEVEPGLSSEVGKDPCDSRGRFSFNNFQEDDDIDEQEEFLEAVQEYGPLTISDITHVLFNVEASEGEPEYEYVKNLVQKNSSKLETREEDGETLYEAVGPFKLCNLYYDSFHKIICYTCAPDPDAVYDDQKDALNHKMETKNDEVVDTHDLFVAAAIPSNWHEKKDTVESVVNRECGNQ